MVNDPFNDHTGVGVMKPMADKQAPASICEAHKEITGPAALESMPKVKFPSQAPYGSAGDSRGHGISGR